MTFGILVLSALVGVLILYRLLEKRVTRILAWARQTDERISTLSDRTGLLEVKDHARDAALHRQAGWLQRMRRDVRSLGRDIGWVDDLHNTQVLKKKTNTPSNDNGDT